MTERRANGIATMGINGFQLFRVRLSLLEDLKALGFQIDQDVVRMSSGCRRIVHDQRLAVQLEVNTLFLASASLTHANKNPQMNL